MSCSPTGSTKNYHMSSNVVGTTHTGQDPTELSLVEHSQSGVDGTGTAEETNISSSLPSQRVVYTDSQQEEGHQQGTEDSL